jgi:hypothetical protein
MAVTAIRNFGSDRKRLCQCLGSGITLHRAMPIMGFTAPKRDFLILTFTILTVTTIRFMNFDAVSRFVPSYVERATF